MSHNSSPPPRGWRPPHYLSIVQHNSLWSREVFLSLSNSFASAKCPPDVVCLQDPPFWRSCLPSSQNFTSFAPPGGTGNKPKVAFYVSTHSLAQATVLPAFFDRPDVVALDLFGVDLFGKSFSHFSHFEFVQSLNQMDIANDSVPAGRFSRNLLPHPCRRGLQHPPPSARPSPLPLRR